MVQLECVYGAARQLTYLCCLSRLTLERGCRYGHLIPSFGRFALQRGNSMPQPQYGAVSLIQQLLWGVRCSQSTVQCVRGAQGVCGAVTLQLEEWSLCRFKSLVHSFRSLLEQNSHRQTDGRSVCAGGANGAGGADGIPSECV